MNIDHTKFEDVWPSSLLSICDLTPDVGAGSRLAGLVIAKHDPRLLSSKREPGGTVSVLGFTLRDSVHDTINVSSWGSQRHVAVQAGLFHIGDVVVVEGFQVVLKQAADTEDNYRPACSSGFSVKLSENTGCVSLYTAADCDSRYRQLATVMPPLSTRPLPLSQLVDTTIPLAQTHTYTVLVAVIRVGAIRDIKTRQGRQTQNREVRVMDQSCTSFSLQLWDTELVQLSHSFTPYSTILLVSQCRVRYDNYRQCNVASSCCQTVITVNPDHPAVHALQQHALKHRAQYSDDHQQHTFIPESIKEQCTVKQVAERAIQLSTSDIGSGTVIVHAFITWIHSESRYKMTKCGKCGRYVPENESSCISSECPGSGGQLQQDFNIRLDIADHTGGLNSILLQASTAQHTLGVNLSEFENMTEEERAQLNQKWLMELSKIWLKYQLRANGKPIFRIMHMERLS